MMEYFFRPKSVAVIGASKDPKKDGNIIVNNLINSDFRGAIYPVNPTADEILGKKAFPSLKEIPGEVDLVVIIIPAKLCVGAMEDCARKGVKAVIIESMGFTEIGAAGKKIQDEIEAIARDAGIRVMGPNCTGIVSRDIATTFFPIRDVPRGNVVLIGQSGLLAAGMASDIVVNQTLNINKICSIGNKCDVNENDLLEYFGDDAQTEVISMYLESIADGYNFVKIARRVTGRKPVIVLNGGRTEAGASAAMSHTGSIASNARIVDAALRQAGCTRADDFTELRDFAKVFSTQPLPRGNGVAVVTAAGSVGVVVSDLCEEHGLKLPRFCSQTVDALKGLFPENMPPSNPVDLWFAIEKLGMTKALEAALGAPLRDPAVDAAILLLAGFSYTLEAVEKKVVQRIAGECGKPVIVCTLVGYNEQKNRIVDEMGRDLPVFTSLISGVKALSKLCEYGIRRHRRSA